MSVEDIIVVEEVPEEEIEDANVALLRELYAAYGRKDRAPLLESLGPDVQFRIVAHPAQFAFGGVRRGPAEVARAIEEIDRDYEWLNYGAHDFIAEGDRVVALTGGTVRHRASGTDIALNLVDLIRFSDGKIVEFVEFFDTGSVLAAQGGSVAPARDRKAAKAATRSKPKRPQSAGKARPARRPKAVKRARPPKRVKAATAKRNAARRR